MKKTALVIGASGLVGKQCLYQLFEQDEYTEVHCLVRRKLAMKSTKLHQHLFDFESPDQYPSGLKADAVFCTIGTTIRTAGSKEAFQKVDYEYPLTLAKLALKNENSKFLLVSALGADPGSAIFYNRVKGELEEALKKFPFPALHIFRPSILDGSRREFRPAEKVALNILKIFSFLLIGPLRKYRPVPTFVLARAMVRASLDDKTGIHIHESDEILRMGKK